MRYPIPVLALSLAMMAALPACESPVASGRSGADDTSSAQKNGQMDEDDLVFFRFADNAPEIADTVVSFWAVRGQEGGVEMRFASAGDEEEDDGEEEDGGEEFLEFEIDENSLLEYPDGRPFQPGDSVLITIRVVDPERFLFEFEPAGLKFNPDEPAELEIDYFWADDDYDDDEDIDNEDARIERKSSIWRQERAGDPYVEIWTITDTELDGVEAEITGFTRYAIATG